MELPTTIWAWMDADGGIPESGEWCGDQIAEYDTEYVRADTIRQLQSENAALRADVERLREALAKIVALDDIAECCGVGSGGMGDQQQCCGSPFYGLDRAQFIARAAIGAS